MTNAIALSSAIQRPPACVERFSLTLVQFLSFSIAQSTRRGIVSKASERVQYQYTGRSAQPEEFLDPRTSEEGSMIFSQRWSGTPFGGRSGAILAVSCVLGTGARPLPSISSGPSIYREGTS